jgi:hypothetical protein
VANVKTEAVSYQLKPKRDFKVIDIANKQLLNDSAIVECCVEADPCF